MPTRINTFFQVGGQIGAETLFDMCNTAWGGGETAFHSLF